MPILTYAQAINEGLREALRDDPRVFLMGEDIGHHGGIFRVTKDLIDEFGAERVRDTPISESGFTGVGIGAAMAVYALCCSCPRTNSSPSTSVYHATEASRLLTVNETWKKPLITNPPWRLKIPAE